MQPSHQPLDPQLINIRRLFPSPLASIQIPDAQWLNVELKALIAQRIAGDTQGAQRSNAGGWQSAHDFAEWGDPAVGGDLEFLDPRGMVASTYNPALRMRVEDCLTAGFSSTCVATSGTFIMFPSWLMHSVRSFEGTRPLDLGCIQLWHMGAGLMGPQQPK